MNLLLRIPLTLALALSISGHSSALAGSLSQFVAISGLSILSACGSTFGSLHSTPDPEVGQIVEFSISFETQFKNYAWPLRVLNYKIVKQGLNWVGDFNFYVCSSQSCQDRFLLYDLRCMTPLTCELLNPGGKPIEKVFPFRISGKSVVSITPKLSPGDPDQKDLQSSVTLIVIDPTLVKSGFFRDWYALEFVAKSGKKTPLIIFFLKSP